MSKPARYTITLPPEMDSAVSEFSRETGVSISDLVRQGLIRVLLEVKEQGSAKIMKWEDARQPA